MNNPVVLNDRAVAVGGKLRRPRSGFLVLEDYYCDKCKKAATFMNCNGFRCDEHLRDQSEKKPTEAVG